MHRFGPRPALTASRVVDTNLLVCGQFFGGAVLPDGQMDYEKMLPARHEYLTNMVKSDYILCARGRIPVFVDTDCVLPFESTVNWRDYCGWVDESDVDRIAKQVADFHAELREHRFIELQHECRRLWEEFLSPEGFFSHLRSQLAHVG